MDARYTNVLKNYSHLTDRPTKQLLDAISVMFDRAPSVIKAHNPIDYWTYWAAVKNFDALVAVMGSVQTLVDVAEKNRQSFEITPQLAAEYTIAKDAADAAFEVVSRIESGEVSDALQRKVELLNAALKEAKLESVSQRSVDDIKTYRQLLAVEKQLQTLQTALFTTKTHHALNRQVASKTGHLETLTARLNKTNAGSVVADLEQAYASAVLQLKVYKQDEKQLLADNNLKAKTALTALHQAELALNAAQLDHFSTIDKATMLAVLRVYDRFIAYKTSFDHAVAGRVDKKGVVTFQDELAARLQRVDQLMETLRCEELNARNAKTIYAQLQMLAQPQRERIFTQKTDLTDIEKLMPLTSTSGIFKVNPVTAARRSQLVYTKTDEERAAKKALYKNRAV